MKVITRGWGGQIEDNKKLGSIGRFYSRVFWKKSGELVGKLFF